MAAAGGVPRISAIMRPRKRTPKELMSNPQATSSAPASGGPLNAEQLADLAAASRILAAQGVVWRTKFQTSMIAEIHRTADDRIFVVTATGEVLVVTARDPLKTADTAPP